MTHLSSINPARINASDTKGTNLVSQVGGKLKKANRGQEMGKSIVPISEESFMESVIHFAQLNGWRVAHFRPALTLSGKWKTAVQGDGRGFPDLVMVKGRRCIIAELKSEKGKTSLDQQAWLISFINTTNEVFEWRPSDWDEIEEILTKQKITIREEVEDE